MIRKYCVVFNVSPKRLQGDRSLPVSVNVEQLQSFLYLNPYDSLIVKLLPLFQKHISFLHGEFSRQISFPRKALDCDFSLYAGGTKGAVR